MDGWLLNFLFKFCFMVAYIFSTIDFNLLDLERFPSVINIRARIILLWTLLTKSINCVSSRLQFQIGKQIEIMFVNIISLLLQFMFFVTQKIFFSYMYGTFQRLGILNVHFQLDQVSKTLCISIWLCYWCFVIDL